MRVEYVPEALDRVDGWLRRLGRLLPKPVRSPLPDGDFVWRFPDEDLAALLLAKAVRVASSLGGAWELAQLGYSSEAGSLLRLMEDFASEIHFMGESHLEGRETRAQRDFREQFFGPPARSIEEFVDKEKQYYVSRREIAKAYRRLAEKAGQDGDLLDRTSSFISYGLNRYVHGSYDTAMELYHGDEEVFMVKGVEGRSRESSLSFLGAKATEGLHAIEMVAVLFGAQDVADEIREFLAEADPDLPLRGKAGS